MKRFSCAHQAAEIIGLWLLAMPAFAQDAATMDELQRVIEAQQEQLEAQQKQLDAQRQLLRELQSQIKSLAKDTDKEADTVTVEKTPGRTSVRAGQSAAATTGRDIPGGQVRPGESNGFGCHLLRSCIAGKDT